jgi:hypothetical protein
MTTAEMMPAHKGAPSKPCGCGCSGSGSSECCELECLVQPRFFCGQLLADQDLTAMVDWVKAKSALQRFRDGWGVVCGLDVHCGTGGTVTVTPGYALDCCGRDVVLCKETSFNAADCWQRDPDPCRGTVAVTPIGAVIQPDPVTTGGKPVPPVDPLIATLPAPGIQPAKFPDGQPATTSSGFQWPEDRQAVDIFVRYSESQSGARSTLSRGGCGCGGGCEYTRVDEGGELYCRPANGCEVPDDPLAKWDEEYAAEARRLATSLIEAARKGDLAALKAHIRRYGLHTFCFLGEWLCDIERNTKGANGQVNQGSLIEMLPTILPWLLQDWRNHRLIRPCTRCGTGTGVRLARVFLARKLNGGKESFSTLYVTAAPPFRRPVLRDEWPVAAGQINLAPYIWQPSAMALPALHRAGVNVRVTTDFDVLTRPERIVFPADYDVMAHVTVDFCDTERIAFFS